MPPILSDEERSAAIETRLDLLSRLLGRLDAAEQAAGRPPLQEDVALSYRGAASISRRKTTTADRRFPLTSLTKPVVARYVLELVGEGELTLEDRASRFLPAMKRPRANAITVRHLLSHTSGLPFVTDRDRDLRQSLAPATAFAKEAMTTPPLTAPGTQAIYSNAGFSILGAIVESVAGEPLATRVNQFLEEAGGCSQVGFGCPPESRVHVQLPAEQDGVGWHWNSDYWSDLAAPWGGLFGSATHAAAVLSRLWCTSARSLRIREAMRPAAGAKWGLGVRGVWTDHTASLGDLLSPTAFGHYGASGNLMWCEGDCVVVVLTDRPIVRQPRMLQQISNVVADLPDLFASTTVD